jgi:hypothetical protein
LRTGLGSILGSVAVAACFVACSGGKDSQEPAKADNVGQPADVHADLALKNPSPDSVSATYTCTAEIGEKAVIKYLADGGTKITGYNPILRTWSQTVALYASHYGKVYACHEDALYTIYAKMVIPGSITNDMVAALQQLQSLGEVSSSIPTADFFANGAVTSIVVSEQQTYPDGGLASSSDYDLAALYGAANGTTGIPIPDVSVAAYVPIYAYLPLNDAGAVAPVTEIPFPVGPQGGTLSYVAGNVVATIDLLGSPELSTTVTCTPPTPAPVIVSNPVLYGVSSCSPADAGPVDSGQDTGVPICPAVYDTLAPLGNGPKRSRTASSAASSRQVPPMRGTIPSAARPRATASPTPSSSTS